MGSSWVSLFIFVLSQLHLIMLTHSMQPLCHRDESFALLQFKESFIIDKSASENHVDFSPYYPTPNCQKVVSWTLEGDKSDCCSWDGVVCDESTGHVIGLDLSSSCLFGSINSTSTLFHLVHLQSLNLTNNNFNYSQIPSQIGDLSRLTDLNLSWSHFSGQIPFEISQLSHLSSLDLSQDYFVYFPQYPHLELKKPNLGTLVGNLTRLQKLRLRGVNISSMVPNILANLSSLTFLSLPFCGLRGEFPMSIFKLSNLQHLSVGGNEGITGYLPDFTWSSPLETLILASTSFSGELPASMGNLGFLTELDMWSCNFSGSIPSSLGNLTKLTSLDLSYNSFVGNIPHSLGNLTILTYLDLSYNSFEGNVLPSLGNLVQLSDLFISGNQLNGSVPFSLLNLPQLSRVDLRHNLLSGEMYFRLMNETRLNSLDLSNNNLTGRVIFGPMNLTQLFVLNLAANKFHGQISNSFSNLKKLEFLDLSDNFLDNIVDFNEFVKLEYLTTLDISGNQLSLLTKETNANSTLHNFRVLGFSSCNLSEFPNFLRNQHVLEYLNLSHNKIRGQVPEWMWNTSTSTLRVLDLSYNFLTSFGRHPIILSGTSLEFLDLKSNLLQGSLPIPSGRTRFFYISNNLLTGNIPELFCNLSSLRFLNLANNSLTGSLPRCLDNFAVYLSVLDLRMNKFQGSIPESWIRRSLSVINLSQNEFQGYLPRLLSNCSMLKVLDLSDNQFIDRFPFWVGHLPDLEVLILRSNKFNGPMGIPQTSFEFTNMRILDISYNNFIGNLPFELLKNWEARKFEKVHSLTYIHENSYFEIEEGFGYNGQAEAYTYTMMMTNKGRYALYEKVQEIFIAIDFSSNGFVGEISESIKNLKGAQLLNLSNNCLTGHIPSSLGNLTELEALDLSHNKLSGKIPQQLTQLTFLEVFNVSHNNLIGPIPQGKQFDTFGSNSFEGNPELCGRPLTKKCLNSDEPPSPTSIFEANQDSGSPFKFGWKIVVIGYGFGFATGVIIGNIVIARKHDWLMKTFKIRLSSRRRWRN